MMIETRAVLNSVFSLFDQQAAHLRVLILTISYLFLSAVLSVTYPEINIEPEVDAVTDEKVKKKAATNTTNPNKPSVKPPPQTPTKAKKK